MPNRWLVGSLVVVSDLRSSVVVLWLTVVVAESLVSWFVGCCQ